MVGKWECSQSDWRSSTILVVMVIKAILFSLDWYFFIVSVIIRRVEDTFHFVVVIHHFEHFWGSCTQRVLACVAKVVTYWVIFQLNWSTVSEPKMLFKIVCVCVHMGVSSCGHICMTETFTLVNISVKLFDIDYIWHNQRCTIAAFDGFRGGAKQMRTQMSIWR